MSYNQGMNPDNNQAASQSPGQPVNQNPGASPVDQTPQVPVPPPQPTAAQKLMMEAAAATAVVGMATGMVNNVKGIFNKAPVPAAPAAPASAPAQSPSTAMPATGVSAIDNVAKAAGALKGLFGKK